MRAGKKRRKTGMIFAIGIRGYLALPFNKPYPLYAHTVVSYELFFWRTLYRSCPAEQVKKHFSIIDAFDFCNLGRWSQADKGPEDPLSGCAGLHRDFAKMLVILSSDNEAKIKNYWIFRFLTRAKEWIFANNSLG
jgi:hypothetical protein